MPADEAPIHAVVCVAAPGDGKAAGEAQTVQRVKRMLQSLPLCVAEPGDGGLADEAQLMQRVSRGLETLASENSTIPDLKHFVQVTGAGLVDGWVRLRRSRMLWHCLPAYRGRVVRRESWK